MRLQMFRRKQAGFHDYFFVDKLGEVVVVKVFDGLAVFRVLEQLRFDVAPLTLALFFRFRFFFFALLASIICSFLLNFGAFPFFAL